MATVVLNLPAIELLMFGPDQAVQRDLLRRGANVLDLARRLLARNNWHGDLDASLRVTKTDLGVGVGSDLRTSDGRANACVVVHNGTGPAHITGNGGIGSVADPRNSYFPPWNKVEFAAWATEHGWTDSHGLARFIFLHGTHPVPFLRDAMVAAVN